MVKQVRLRVSHEAAACGCRWKGDSWRLDIHLSSYSLIAFPWHLFWISWQHEDLMAMELFMLQVRISEGGCWWAMWRLNLLYDFSLGGHQIALGSHLTSQKTPNSLFCLRCIGYKSNLSTERVWKTTLSDNHVAWLSWERTIFHIMSSNHMVSWKYIFHISFTERWNITCKLIFHWSLWQ